VPFPTPPLCCGVSAGLPFGSYCRSNPLLGPLSCCRIHPFLTNAAISGRRDPRCSLGSRRDPEGVPQKILSRNHGPGLARGVSRGIPSIHNHYVQCVMALLLPRQRAFGEVRDRLLFHFLKPTYYTIYTIFVKYLEDKKALFRGPRKKICPAPLLSFLV
jgi:hypothetical protein